MYAGEHCRFSVAGVFFAVWLAKQAGLSPTTGALSLPMLCGVLSSARPFRITQSCSRRRVISGAVTSVSVPCQSVVTMLFVRSAETGKWHGDIWLDDLEHRSDDLARITTGRTLAGDPPACYSFLRARWRHVAGLIRRAAVQLSSRTSPTHGIGFTTSLANPLYGLAGTHALSLPQMRITI